MGNLKVERVIATGHSQSAGRLATYFNSVHPLAPVYDAVVLHGGGGKMRTDLNVKIWKLLSETDVLGQVATRQADSDKFRTWEVAGTSHLDTKHATELVKLGLRSKETMLPNPPPAPAGGGAGRRGGGPAFGGTPGPYNGCNHPPLSQIPSEYVQNALYDHLARWIKDGTAPPTGPAIEINDRRRAARDRARQLRQRARRHPPGRARGRDGHQQRREHRRRLLLPDRLARAFDKDRLKALYSTHEAYVSAVKMTTEQNLKDRLHRESRRAEDDHPGRAFRGRQVMTQSGWHFLQIPVRRTFPIACCARWRARSSIIAGRSSPRSRSICSRACSGLQDDRARW